MCNNFEISLVVFMPNITTNHAITYTNILMEMSVRKGSTIEALILSVRSYPSLLKVAKVKQQQNFPHHFVESQGRSQLFD